MLKNIERAEAKKDCIFLQRHFEENSLINSDIESFNNFIDKELQKIIEENGDIEPTIIPSNVDEFKIRLDKIWVTKPEITEADGSKRNIYPSEARLRKLTYSAPVYIEVSSHINGSQRENFQTQIASLPIMIKSKYCHLSSMSREDLIKKGEDPDEPGGYFIISGTEKVLIDVEDLASNRYVVSKNSTGTVEYSGKIFSEQGSYKIPHTIEKQKDGIFYLSFTRVKKMPLIVVLKALGLTKDQEITEYVSKSRHFDEVLINLYEFSDIKNQEEALDYISKRIGITQTKDIRLNRTKEILDKYLLPHLGITVESRKFKAINLCKMVKRYILVSNKNLLVDDKDHYMNKRLKLSGDLLADLIRVNLKVLIGDLLYNFQRIVKRGKFPSVKSIIRDKLLTQRIYSSMATGAWVGARKGISQRIERVNYVHTLSQLQGVISPLSAERENFEARELHPTHFGRLCPSETPEGTKIGLKKNLALLARITQETDNTDVLKSIKKYGAKTII